MTVEMNESEMTIAVGEELEVDHVIENRSTVEQIEPITSPMIEIEEIDQIIEISEKGMVIITMV